jgi:hypothetical protein
MKALSVSWIIVGLLSLAGALALGGFAFTLQEAEAAEKHGSSQKVIDFEDETIEGLNKRPLDSLSQLSEKDKRKRKPHLYRKRASFRSETSETLRVMRYTQ